MLAATLTVTSHESTTAVVHLNASWVLLSNYCTHCISGLKGSCYTLYKSKYSSSLMTHKTGLFPENFSV